MLGSPESSGYPVRQIDHDGLASFCLASYPVDAAGSLLDGAGIPCEIMVNHMTAESSQVDAFAHHLAAHEHVRKEGRIERPHQSRPGICRMDLEGLVRVAPVIGAGRLDIGGRRSAWRAAIRSTDGQ